MPPRGPSSLIKDHLAGGASRLHPTAHKTRGGGPGLAALLLPHILPVCSVVAPCHPGAALRDLVLVQRGRATSAPLSAVLRAAVCAFALLVPCVETLAAAGAPDQIAIARRLYNEGKFDEALDAARKALSTPATASSARLVMGRIQIERYRLTPTATTLDDAKSALRAVDPRALDQRERIELQVGLATLLYFEDRFGAAAELLDPVVDSSATLAPDAHERALEWWATALDRQAQAQPAGERTGVYLRISERMEQELRRDSGSGPASYWLAASARGAGDIERAWSAAAAGWIRASLARDRGVTLKADLDRLMTTAIIPDRAAKVPVRERKQALTSMAAEWEHFKRIW